MHDNKKADFCYQGTDSIVQEKTIQFTAGLIMSSNQSCKKDSKICQNHKN